jgi:hypothetical protein
MSESRQLTTYFRAGLAAIAVGVVTAIAGALFAHFTGLPPENDLGAEIYPAIPRGWGWVLIGQVISLGGSLLALAGTTLAFLYKREMTWARAALGATLFSALMMVLFGIIPNEWLTLTQATFEWTPQKIFVTIPEWLTLGNEVSISYAAIKDIVSGTYVVVVLGAVAGAMYWWQEQEKKAQAGPPPEPVSRYGRPLTKVER